MQPFFLFSLFTKTIPPKSHILLQFEYDDNKKLVHLSTKRCSNFFLTKLDVIKIADYIVDLGPEGGNRGGTVVVSGTPEEVAACESSYTGKFLKGVLEKDKMRRNGH